MTPPAITPRRYPRRAAFAVAAWALVAALLLPPAAPAAAAVNWTGSGGASWATGGSWSNNSGPATIDTAAFTDAGASPIPGDPTSFLNVSRTIGGLSFGTSATKYQTLDLGGQTLTIAGNVNTGTNSSATIRNGNLVVSGPFANIYAGWALSQAASSTADLSGLTSLNATLQDVQVGTSMTASSSGTGFGTLSLPPTNAITANRVIVGGSFNNSGETRGTLHLGLNNTITANEFTVALNNSYGTVDIPNGGTLALGTAAQPTLLQVAAQNFGTTNFYNGKLDLSSAATFNANLSSLVVGQKEGVNSGSGTGTLLGAAGGTINVGAAGTSTANFYVGRMLTGNNSAAGLVDLASMTALNANLNALTVGTAVTGQALGNLLLPKTAAITANTITVGSNSGNQTSSLTLGRTNSIVTNQFTVGTGLANATVTIPNGGSLALGSPAQRAGLFVAVGVVGNNTPYISRFDLTGGTFNAYLADLVVGEKDGAGTWPLTGTLLGGGGGSVEIGAPGTNTANVFVGHNLNSTASAIGNVDFSGLGSLTANVNTLTVGASALGDAQGTMSLAANNTINANTVVVGGGGKNLNTLALGKTNTIVANQFVVGRDNANATVTIRSGGSLTLGSPAQRTGLMIGTGVTPLNTPYTSTVNLTGASFGGHLADLVVGQKDGAGDWPVSASLFGAGGGTLDIGAPGNTAGIYVARNLNGTGGVSGTVDLSGLTSLTANLNTLSIGTSPAAPAQGSMSLAKANTISANTIVVGSGGNSSNSLTLGLTNTILVNQLFVSQDKANGNLTIPSGGSLNLGSPAQRANVSIATGHNEDTNTYVGTLDLTNAAVVAYLDNVLVGNRTTNNGGATATLTLGNRAENRIDVNAITIAGPRANGTVQFGGGQMAAGNIAAGGGTAAFNWTGGQLSVGTFGTPAISFNLNNTGSGTLAPGSSAAAVGTTTVNGNYAQSASAATAIDIAGVTPGTGNDLVNVTGTATLAGTLRLTILNNFAPAVGQNVVIANYGSRSGTYAFVAPPHLPQDVAFTLDYASNPTQLAVRMVAPAAQTYTSAATTGTFATAANWDTQATPGTTSSVTIVNAAAAPKTVTVGTSTTVHRVVLQGTAGPLKLDLPQGVQLGVANQVVVGANATLSGGGTVVGDVVLAGGAVAPGAVTNALSVGGTFTSQPGSTFHVDLAGAAASGNYNRVAVAGAAALGGTLDVAASGPAPAPLDSYRVLTFASRTGRFQSYANLDVPGPLVLAPVYSDTDLRLVATLAGDATMDGAVDFNDLIALAQNYNSALAAGAEGWQRGDFTHDRTVDFNDLVQLAQNYNTSATGAPLPDPANFDADVAAAFAAVPEPSAAFSLGAAAALLLLSGRRKFTPRSSAAPAPGR